MLSSASRLWTRSFSAVGATLAAFVLSAPSALAQQSAPAPQVAMQGSDTMVILGQKWAQTFMGLQDEVQVSVTGGGSGTGIAALLNGTCDIAQASRPMKPAEKRDFAKKFRARPLELEVALDGIAVFVSESNPLEEVTLEQLKDLYQGKVSNFSQIGGADQKTTVYGRESNSGTYSTFKELVLDNGDFAASVQALAGTAAVINAVSKDPGGVGYGGIGYGSGVKLLKIKPSGADEALEPSEENVRSGAYPLARPLYFYLNPKKLAPAAAAFAKWTLSEEGQSVVDGAGYYRLSEDAVAASLATLAETADKEAAKAAKG